MPPVQQRLCPPNHLVWHASRALCAAAEADSCSRVQRTKPEAAAACRSGDAVCKQVLTRQCLCVSQPANSTAATASCISIAEQLVTQHWHQAGQLKQVSATSVCSRQWQITLSSPNSMSWAFGRHCMFHWSLWLLKLAHTASSFLDSST